MLSMGGKEDMFSFNAQDLDQFPLTKKSGLGVTVCLGCAYSCQLCNSPHVQIISVPTHGLSCLYLKL